MLKNMDREELLNYLQFKMEDECPEGILEHVSWDELEGLDPLLVELAQDFEDARRLFAVKILEVIDAG